MLQDNFLMERRKHACHKTNVIKYLNSLIHGGATPFQRKLKIPQICSQVSNTEINLQINAKLAKLTNSHWLNAFYQTQIIYL